jgi:hypothetical protein
MQRETDSRHLSYCATLAEYPAMVEIKCDNCDAVKRPNEETRNAPEWILGWDLISESPNAVQRSIRFLDHWDQRRIAEFGAIHFCSIECREQYIADNRAAA